jgi:predicted glycosyltransferase involved in capsule biosynthesis
MNTDIKNGLTIVMPTRIDSDTRKRNLLYVIRRLSVIGCKILILEADKHAKLTNENIDIPNVEYHFVEDSNSCFFRTHYINILLNMANTEVVAVWDADIVTSYEQIEEAYSYVQDKGYVLTYPYSGDYILLGNDDSSYLTLTSDLKKFDEMKLHSMFGHPSYGGAYFVNREQYLELGGENEHFTGWGPEDYERMRRMEIFECKYGWIKSGRAYHLNHPRSRNSTFFSKRNKCEMEKELVKVCSMDKDELINYIKNW